MTSTSSGSTWSGANNTYQHYQNGYAAYAKNSEWPNGVFMTWGFKGRSSYDDYKNTSNPIRGKILYCDQ